jgi:hypothetical protein
MEERLRADVHKCQEEIRTLRVELAETRAVNPASTAIAPLRTQTPKTPKPPPVQVALPPKRNKLL